MPFEEAAALPLAGSTVLQSLRNHGRLKRGDRVLINGASGGVGAFAVQIAKAYGAEVTGVASGKNEPFVRSLGADHFINYHETDFAETDHTWDVIFDVAGKSSYWQSRRVLAKEGRFISTEPNVSGVLTSVLTRWSSQPGTIMLARPCQQDLRELVRLYEAGELKVTIDKVIPLAEADRAHRRIEQGVDRGKIVLHIPD
jgi:NADPH2:quinone reductase